MNYVHWTHVCHFNHRHGRENSVRENWGGDGKKIWTRHEQNKYTFIYALKSCVCSSCSSNDESDRYTIVSRFTRVSTPAGSDPLSGPRQSRPATVLSTDFPPSPCGRGHRPGTAFRKLLTGMISRGITYKRQTGVRWTSVIGRHPFPPLTVGVNNKREDETTQWF